MFEGLTNKGKEYMAKCLAENKPVSFVKVKIGNGTINPGENPETFIDIKSIKKEVSIVDKTQIGDTAKLTVQLDNTGVLEGYFPREIGIYVQDGGQELLYWYINDGSESSWLPPASKSPVKFKYHINLMVTNLETVIVNWSGKELWVDREYLGKELDKKLTNGNLPSIITNAETIFKALQANTGIKFDENLLYLNDAGTKNVGFCYLDRLTDGIFECIQETTTTVNNATYFKNFSNKENSDRLSNLEKYSLTNYKGEYDEATSYKNGDVVLVKGLEEGYCFEVTNPEMADSGFPKLLRKVFKVNSEMYFEMVDNNWEIIFDRETPLELYTIPQKGTTQNYSSTFDNYYPFSEMRRVILKNGVEQYELDFNDSTKKKDGGSSNLTGTDGDVMVRIPKFYCDIKKVAKGNRYRVFTFKNPTGKLPLGLKPHPLFESVNKYYTGAYEGFVENGILKSVTGKSPTVSKTIASFRDSARQGRDNKFNITSVNELSAIFILFLIEFADLNSQKLLGQGRSNTSSLSATGTTNALGSRSGRISTDDANGNISYRGIEDVFGNIWSFVDGFLMCDDGYYYTNNPANYGNKAQMTHFKASPVTGEGYISKIEWIKGIEHLFIPSEIKATDSTYYCDYIWCHQAGEENIVLAGGDWADGSRYGLACLNCLSVASDVYSGIGARLSYASL